MGLLNFKWRTSTPLPDGFITLMGSSSNSWLDFQKHETSLYSYLKCPQVSFPLLKRASALKNALVEVLDNKDNFINDVQLKSKLQQPNATEDYGTWRGKIDTYVQLFGYAVVYFKGSIMGNPLSAKEWLVLSPMDLKPRYKNLDTRKFDNELLGFDTINLDYSFIPIADCWVIRSQFPNPGNRFIPIAPINTVAYQVSNTILSYEVRNSFLVNRGAVGIISQNNKDIQASIIPKLKDEIDEVKKNYYGEYGLTDGKSPLIFSNMNLSFTRIQWSIDDMKIFDEIKESSQRIFDAFGVKMELASGDEHGTFTNQQEYWKQLYIDTIIPTDQDFYKSLTTRLGLDKKGYRIAVFYDHVEPLQEGEKEKAEAKKAIVEAYLPLYESGIITYNQLLTVLGYDEVLDGDKYKENE